MLNRASVAFMLAALLAAAAIVTPAAGGKKGGGKKPDLKMQKVDGVPHEAEDGDAATVEAKVKNVGKAKAEKSKISLYLSSDKSKSTEDDKLPGKKPVPKVKPGKSTTVKVGTKLGGSDGDWYVIACASKAKKEKKGGNNCKASRKLTIGSSSDPGGGPWPQRYEGTFTASFSLDQNSENPGKGLVGAEDFSGAMSGDLVLTRQPGDLPYGPGRPWHYESSGSLEWSGNDTTSYQDGSDSEDCSGQGSGEKAINPFAGVSTQRYAFVVPDRDFSPGTKYATFGDEASDLKFEGTCTSTSTPGPYNGDRSPVFPAILPRDYDDDCRLKGGSYVVKPDGSLAGTDSCKFDYDYTLGNGSHFVGTNTATWSWNLVPVG